MFIPRRFKQLLSVFLIASFLLSPLVSSAMAAALNKGVMADIEASASCHSNADNDVSKTIFGKNVSEKPVSEKPVPDSSPDTNNLLDHCCDVFCDCAMSACQMQFISFSVERNLSRSMHVELLEATNHYLSLNFPPVSPPPTK